MLCILPFFSPEPAVIRKTIKPKIIIINLNPRRLPSKGIILHKRLCRYSIRMCEKGLLSKNRIHVYLLLKKNWKIFLRTKFLPVSSVLFISWSCFKIVLHFLLLIWFDLMRSLIDMLVTFAHHDLFISCILYMESNIKILTQIVRVRDFLGDITSHCLSNCQNLYVIKSGAVAGWQIRSRVPE